MPVSGSLCPPQQQSKAHRSLGHRFVTRGVSVFLGLGTLFGGTSASFADIISDGSTGSIVFFDDCLGAPCTITGGETRGDNLFHSFSEFVIPPGGNAILGTLTPALFSDVDRIFIRVVGSRTEIDGSLTVDNFFFTNSPDVVFLSPQGIRIGQDAQLSYPGSFLLSSAERIDFGGGAIFDATNSDPLLTLSGFENLPGVLRLGNAPGEISFGNSGSSLRERIDIPQGHKHQFAVIGDQINFDNVEISTPGALTFLSVDANQIIGLNPLTSGIIFNYPPSVDLDDVTLNNSELLIRSLSSSDNAEIVEIVGENLSLDQSQIQSETDLNGGNISFDLTGALVLTGQSEITAEATDPVASAGNITITADSFDLLDQNKIETSSNSTDGNIDLTIVGDVRVENSSQILTTSSSTATSGSNVTLDATGRVLLLNQSAISTQPGADIANLGLIDITSASLDLLNNSEISTIAGKVLINSVSQTRLAQNSSVTSATATAGGDITIEVDNGSIELDGQSRISTQTTGLTADAGNITLTSEGLDLLNQSQISTSTGAGGRGDIDLNLTAGVTLDNQSKILTEAAISPADAGNIFLVSTGLDLLNNSQVSTSTNAADGRINLFVIGDAQIDSGSSISTTAQNNSAIAGNINFGATSLTVQNLGKVTSGSNGFTSGDITINLGNGLVVSGNGEISTVANSPSSPITNSSAGNIVISGNTLAILQDSGKIYSVTGDTGGDVTLNFNTGDISLSNAVANTDNFIATRAVGTGDAGTLSLTAGNLSLRDQSQILSETGQGGGDLTFDFSGDLSLNTGASIASKATEGSGGSAGGLDLVGQNLTIDGENSIIFSLTESGGGNISLDLSDDVTLMNGAQLGAFLTNNGDTINGDVGSILLQALNLSLNNNADIITETANGSGNIDIDLVGDLAVIGGNLGNSEIIAKLSTTKGAAGTISIDANNVTFDQGFLLTETDQPGGNVDVNATGVLEFAQSLIRLSSPTGTGHTGNLSLESQSSTAPTGILLINTEVFNEATNTGGDVVLTAQGEVEMRDGSYISIDSSGANGNFTVAASAFRSNDVGADNDVLLNQGTLNDLSLPVEVAGFDPLADQVVRTNANSELLPNPFPPPVAPPVIPPTIVTPPSPPELPGLQPTPVIPSSPEPQAPLPSVMAPLGNNSIVEPLDTPTSRPTPPETNGNAPPPYSEFRYLSSQTENFLTVEDLLAFYGSAQSLSSNFQPRSCLASGPSHFKISGRGGIGSSPSSLYGSSQSLVDLGQFDGDAVSDSSTNFSQPIVESSEPSSHWHEAQTWQQNSHGEIELVAQSNWLGTPPKNHRCQSLG